MIARLAVGVVVLGSVACAVDTVDGPSEIAQDAVSSLPRPLVTPDAKVVAVRDLEHPAAYQGRRAAFHGTVVTGDFPSVYATLTLEADGSYVAYVNRSFVASDVTCAPGTHCLTRETGRWHVEELDLLVFQPAFPAGLKSKEQQLVIEPDGGDAVRRHAALPESGSSNNLLLDRSVRGRPLNYLVPGKICHFAVCPEQLVCDPSDRDVCVAP